MKNKNLLIIEIISLKNIMMSKNMRSLKKIVQVKKSTMIGGLAMREIGYGQMMVGLYNYLK